MNTPSFAQAIQLNKEGVYYIEHGNYTEAMSVFARCLSIVKQVNEEFKCCPSLSESVNACSFFRKIKHDITDMDTSDDFQDIKENFIFKNPILIEQHSMLQMSCGSLSFITMYNLALSHHLYAAKHGMPNKVLRKALTLYELAYASLLIENQPLPPMQAIAIMNNIGQIHSALKNTEEAQICFQDVLSTICFLRECGEHESIDQLDGFMGNVMPLLLKQSPSAPLTETAPAA